ncbi:MAG: hypothetical protein ACI4TU_04260 [Candidatus Cryptobacteroides sp.]
MGVAFKFLPIVNPQTGQTSYVDAEWFRPVRKYVFKQKDVLTGPVQFADVFE